MGNLESTAAYPVMNFLSDLKLAFRLLSRTKGLALAVVLTLALGIGANTAIFSVVRGVLLRPLVNRYHRLYDVGAGRAARSASGCRWRFVL